MKEGIKSEAGREMKRGLKQEADREMKQAAVLGIGNRLMGDDGVGNCVVEELKRRNAFPGFRLIAGETDTDYCLDELEDTDTAFLIDASSLGAEPCSVTVFSLGDVLRDQSSSLFPHSFNLFHAMRQHHYEGDGLLIAVEACSVECRFGLSPGMEERFPLIVDEIDRHIENYLNLYHKYNF